MLPTARLVEALLRGFEIVPMAAEAIAIAAARNYHFLHPDRCLQRR